MTDALIQIVEALRSEIHLEYGSGHAGSGDHIAGFEEAAKAVLAIIRPSEIPGNEKLDAAIKKWSEVEQQLKTGIPDKEIMQWAETLKHDLYWKGSVEYVDRLVAEIKRLREPKREIGEVLQERVTLDEAALSMSTFPNGCDFRLVMDGKTPFLEYGCYGVHVNLAQGKRRLLMEWLGTGKGVEKKRLNISPETLSAILSRAPCECCGGTKFKPEIEDGVKP